MPGDMPGGSKNDSQGDTKDNTQGDTVDNILDNILDDSIDDKFFFPIAALNPHEPNWIIKAKCTFRSTIEYYIDKNKCGGSAAHVNLMDKKGNEILAIMFKRACDKFHPVFEKHSIYIIKKGILKKSNKKYTHIEHDYKIVLYETSIVINVNDNIYNCNYSNINVKWKFISVSEVSKKNQHEFVDVLGIVENIEELSSIICKKNDTTLDKKSIIIFDNTGSIEITLWGEVARQFPQIPPHNPQEYLPIIAFKGAQVVDFLGDKKLTSKGNYQFYPKCTKKQLLTQWYVNKEIPDTKKRNLNEMTSSDTQTSWTPKDNGGKTKKRKINNAI